MTSAKKPATAYVYYDGKRVLDVVGYRGETPEALLARTKGAIFVTVEPARSTILVDDAQRTTVIEHGGDPDAEYP